jgi:hypothetical protein
VRTTLSIDDDIASLVEQEVRKSGDSFKATINRLLRQGLMAAKEKPEAKPFVVTPFPIGLGQKRNYDSIPELLEELEGPYHL